MELGTAFHTSNAQDSQGFIVLYDDWVLCVRKERMGPTAGTAGRGTEGIWCLTLADMMRTKANESSDFVLIYANWAKGSMYGCNLAVTCGQWANCRTAGERRLASSVT